MITAKMVTYIDLSNKPETFCVPAAPSFYYLIYSLECVVRDSTDSYLLLNYSTYALDNGGIKECIWAPPFFACHAPAPLLGGRDVGHIKEAFGNVEKSIAEDEEIQRRLYILGAVGARVQYLGEILEYKQSPREPERMKCYKIKRYAVSVSDELGLLNIVDPENLRGHTFLPLNRLDEVLRSRATDGSNSEYWFKGKPLASHLCRLLERGDERQRWLARAINVPGRLFQFSERGLLVRFDISGYGATCDYIRSNMGTFEQTGVEVEQWFNGALYKLFLASLARAGVSRLRLEGDGFLFSMPEAQYPEGSLVKAIETVLRILAELRGSLGRFNSSIRDSSRWVSGRAAVTVGEYRYGRIGELFSSGAEWEGPGITAVARLEQALREYRQKHTAQGTSATAAVAPAADGEHSEPNLILGLEVSPSLQELLRALDVFKIEEVRVHVKEYKALALICNQG